MSAPKSSSAPSASAASKSGASTAYRITAGGPFSGTWKIWAGIGALGLAGAAAGFTMDAKRAAFAYLFAFFCFLTPALGALFFVFVQHMTSAGWSVTVRRTAEFFMAGLPLMAVLAVPVVLSAGNLYPWFTQAGEHGGDHGGEHGGASQGHSSVADVLEGTAHAQDHQPDDTATKHGVNPAPGAEDDRPREEESRAKGMSDTHPTVGATGGPETHGNVHDSAHGNAEVEHAEHAMHARVLDSKRPYLNKTFFYIRFLFYALVWIGLATRFFRLSTDQDTTKRVALTNAAKRLSPIAAVLFGLSLTFAAIDWVMGLDPMWYSTIWGVQMFAGGVISSLALIILTLMGLKKAGLLGNAVNVEHLHDLGKLMFGFLVFWAYVSFSQFFLVWYSNIPEETTFYMRRWHDMNESWKGVSWFLFFGHFIVPFLILLSRNTKRRTEILGLGAVVILVTHFTEIYWLVLPNFGPLVVSWLDIACFLGIGGAYLAVVFHRMTRFPLIPVGDPRLERALHFEQV